MAIDYDLVIIGDTLEGRMAALKFAQCKARVALVQQPASDRVDCAEGLFLQGLKQVLADRLDPELLSALGIISQQSVNSCIQPDYEALCAWLTNRRESNEEALSLPLLAIAGVDVVLGSGEFVRLPHLQFVLPNRKLRSRFYLLATGAVYCRPAIPGLAEIDYLTPQKLQKPQILQALPQALTIVGNSLLAVAWAQLLRRLGHSVTFLSSSPLLPSIDRTLAYQLQAQLEAEGIVISASKIQQVSRLPDRFEIQLSDRSLESEGLIIAASVQPNLAGLNTEKLGLRLQQHRLDINVHLQTAHPCIYTCGRIIQQTSSPQIVEHEIRIILKSLLIYPLFSANYYHIPVVSSTLPTLATVGITEERAKVQFGDRVSIRQRSLSALPKIQGTVEELGYIKLILLDNQQILGAHLLGAGAEELIGLFALAIQQKMGWNAIAKLTFPSGTFAEGVQKLMDTYQQEQLKKSRFRQQWLESLWLWRR